MNAIKTSVGVLGLALASTAPADIISVATPADLLDGNGATNATFGLPGANQVTWDIDADGVDDLGFSHVRNTNFPNFWLSEIAVLDAAGVTGVSNDAGFIGIIDTASMVAAGDSVASAPMVQGQGTHSIVQAGRDQPTFGFIGDWGGVGDPLIGGILGFQLSSGNFGWVEFDAGQAGVFFRGAAFEDSGADILAGTIPAPGSISLMLAAGCATSRRRRRI